MKNIQPTPEQQDILDRLNAKPDADIDYSDIPSRNTEWWTGKGGSYKLVCSLDLCEDECRRSTE